MRIASGTVDFSSTHLASERSTRKKSLRSWVGDRRPDFEALERDGDRNQDRRLPGRRQDGENQLQGAVRASGIYVKEDRSGLGSVQQIDLAVYAALSGRKIP